MIYEKRGDLKAVQLLLGHAKLESTVRYVGIEVDDPLSISEQLNWERTALCDTRMRVTAGWENWRFLAQSGCSLKAVSASTNRQHHSIRSLGPMTNRTVMQQPSA
jgi:hypothetical protein